MGDAACVLQLPHALTARAATHCRVAVLSSQAIDQLLASQHDGECSTCVRTLCSITTR